jgi:uncharacterized protein
MKDLSFEWDPARARANSRKHGVSFDEAKTVFRDMLALRVYDGEHSWDEERFIIIGMCRSGSTRENYEEKSR